MKWKDFVRNVLIKTFALFFVLLVLYWGSYLYKDMVDNVQRKKKHKRWEMEGISPITRGIHPVDTIKIDTIK